MTESGKNNRRRIAIVGKGGTGKSALTALMVRAYTCAGGSRSLVIDADPTMGLCHVLGVRAGKTLEHVRNEIISKAGRGNPQDREEFIHQLDYYLFEALIEEKGFALLAMGQPQQSGCFCPANALLKEAIESLSSQFDRVLIDCEAGLEQISRKVIGNIDMLIIVTDPTRRGVQTAQDIKKAASRFTRAGRIGLIVNRVRDDAPRINSLIEGTDLTVLGLVPEDAMISEWDFAGKPIIDLPDDSTGVAAMNSIIENI